MSSGPRSKPDRRQGPSRNPYREPIGMTNAEDNQNTQSAAQADAERAFATFGSQVSPKVRERILREGLAAWREQGLISAEQHGRLLAHTGAAAPPPRETASDD